MSCATFQATSRDWLRANEGIRFSSHLHSDIGTLSLAGSSTILDGDISSELARWDELSDEALLKFEETL